MLQCCIGDVHVEGGIDGVSGSHFDNTWARHTTLFSSSSEEIKSRPYVDTDPADTGHKLRTRHRRLFHTDTFSENTGFLFFFVKGL